MTPDPEDKLRLGGMALRNGLLVHGPTHWAAAVRTDDGDDQGRLRPQAAAARAPTPIPGVRGVVRLGEAFAVIPLVKRGAARGAGCRSRTRPCSASPPARRSAARCCAGACAAPAARSAAALISLAPALFALRGGELAAYHGVEHKAIAAYEADDDDAARRDQGARALRLAPVAPMLAANLAGTLLLRARVEQARPARRRRGRARLHGRRGRGLRLVRAQRRARRSRGRSSARASSSSALVGTREPDERQLEVGRAALAEILRVEAELGSRPPVHAARSRRYSVVMRAVDVRCVAPTRPARTPIRRP